MAIAIVTLSASATKIYVCGTKITGTTSFNAGGGTVSYNESTNTLTITNVYYLKSGSSNNGISVDECNDNLTINLVGNVTFGIADADAVLLKSSGKSATINVSDYARFYTSSSGHAALKLQSQDVTITGPGELDLDHINSSTSVNAVKGGTGNENLTFKIKNCDLQSNGPQLYNLNKVYFGQSSYYDTGNYSSRSTTISFNSYSGTAVTYHAQNIKSWGKNSWVNIFLPIEYYYSTDFSIIASYDLAGASCVVSDYIPAVIVNSTKVPDYYLRNHLLSTIVPNGYLTKSQMNAVTTLNVSGKTISSLKGIQQFENVKEFNCSNNNLSSLDYMPDPSTKSVLQTLNCSNNKLTSIDVQGYSNLTTLYCNNNQIAFSNPRSVLPTSLTYLNCANNKITKLDFNNGYYSTYFDHLTNLDCSNNPYLTEISSSDGQLTTLNVSGCTSLTKIVCDANKISSLSSIPSSVKNLNLSSNQLTSLPSLPSGLETLSATSNKFTSFSLSNHSSIKLLQIGNNPNLTSLTINNNSKLEKVYAYYITSSGTINCNNNSSLTILNVEESTGLKTLNCYGNTALTSLWLTGCSSLTTFDCHGSALTGIGDLNHCTALTTLICNNNQLTSLNLTGCSALTYLSCQNNQIKSFTNLPTTLQTIYCNDNKLSGGTFDVSGRSALKILDIRNNPNFSGLKCNNCSLTSLSVSGCTGLTTLICNNNQLTSLDVSSLSNLTELKCHYNKLASLNVSNKTKLTTLYANANQLTSINVQGCSVLNDLNVECNKLTSLSVQGCNALRTINCCINKISASGANTLINSLCTIPSGSQGALRYIYPGYSSSSYVENNVNLTDAQVRSARNKRWVPYKYNGSSWVVIPAAVPGDVNGDGQVTAADITALYDVLLNNNYSHVVNGDQTGDGQITAADVTKVYTIMLGGQN